MRVTIGADHAAFATKQDLVACLHELCHDTYSAHQGVEHDEMNVLVLGSRVIDSELARDMVRADPPSSTRLDVPRSL